MNDRLSRLSEAGHEIASIPVPINYDIIRLFSEGLYRSPHKAVEELVTNGYDAGAQRVHIILPEQPEDEESAFAPLWVIDDGHGMDNEGFHHLWRVAESEKTDIEPNGRAPIGQFGIGKLAAYVLAWRLTHLSRTNGKLLLTTMDFRRVTGRQNDPARPVRVALREIDESTAREYLADISDRDPLAWKFMFDDHDRSDNWTAAALTDFKDLYNQLSAGRLRWVLSSGLPLHSEFGIWLDGEQVSSSKENLAMIRQVDVNEHIEKIGTIKGKARIYERQLTYGKSDQFGRSHGYFIRVRGRVINLEDELFGIQQPNHAAWSRFAMEIDADGLRDHLLSSREGVRDSEAIGTFRKFLLKTFNECRTAYDEWNRRQNEALDISGLLLESPSSHVIDPLVRSVSNTVRIDVESFYIDVPRDVSQEDRSEWFEDFKADVSSNPFDKTTFVKDGANAPALRYIPVDRNLTVNSDHPFVDKLTRGDKQRMPAKLFASSEVLLEGQLQEQGIDQTAIANFLRDRDRVLRLAAGDAPPTANEVLRRLEVATRDDFALERAVGSVFRLLGFEYERKGGNASGPDGVLYARLGRHKARTADYKVVYDAKQTNQPSVPADKIDVASLESFRIEERADFGFFIATAYAAETKDQGAVNRKIRQPGGKFISLLKVKHLNRLVWQHFHNGVTLTELRSLFESARTVPEVDEWIDELEQRLCFAGEVPLVILLNSLEAEKRDTNATPNISAVRANHDELKRFEPDRLVARLKAVESIVGARWIEVEEDSRDVLMYHTSEEILEELQRNIGGLATKMIEDRDGSS